MKKIFLLKFRIFLKAAFFVIAFSGFASPAGAGEALSLPPDSLAQWYKPANKRQVWLHTMFRLRRAMQAVEEYAAQEDRPGMEKWARRLVKDYRRIPEMVPEWADEIELEWADRLAASAAQGQTGKIARALRKLGQTCKSCHRQFRAVTAALFRTPDYHEIQVEDPLGKVPYPKAMKQLGRSLNRIKIGIEDERWQAAREAGDAFTSQLRELGNSCKNCHRDAVPRERILGAGTADVLAELTTAIERREAQNARKLLGRAAVQICARCHGIHRTLADLKHAVKSAKE